MAGEVFGQESCHEGEVLEGCIFGSSFWVLFLRVFLRFFVLLWVSFFGSFGVSIWEFFRCFFGGDIWEDHFVCGEGAFWLFLLVLFDILLCFLGIS